MNKQNCVEEWKVYKDTRTTGRNSKNKNLWEVSNFGRVKRNGELYECRLLAKGYKGFSKNVYLHKAVAELFIPNPENKPEVDHINTNTLDNRVENLRWCTHKENCRNILTRNNYSQARIRDNNPMYGRKHSEETRKKISESQKGHAGYRKGKSTKLKGQHWKLVNGRRLYY